MAEAEFVLARILGGELTAERYSCQVRSWRTAPTPEEGLSGARPSLGADLVVWCAGDERARRAGRALCESAGEAGPGFLEVPGWADAPLAELLRCVRPVEEAPQESVSDASEEAAAPELQPAEDQQTSEVEGPPAPAGEPATEVECSGGSADLLSRLDFVLGARANRQAAA